MVLGPVERSRLPRVLLLFRRMNRTKLLGQAWVVDARATTTGIVGIGVVLALMAAAMDSITVEAFSGLLTLLVLTLLAIPVLQWVARREGEPQMTRILVAALAAKVAGTLLRYFVITVVYGDVGDAGVYSRGGGEVASNLRSGIFDLSVPSLAGRGVETERIAQVVGIVYTFTGVSRYAAAFVFAFICFAGQVFMWRAFHQAVPEGDHRRYAVLVLFLPSMLFWPSSIGKEALMVGCIGLVSYGAAQILGDRARVSGIAFFLAGAVGLFLIRPHMALIAIVALGVASAIGTLSGMRVSGSSRRTFVRLAALLVLIGAAAVATSGLSRFFAEGKTDDEAGVSSVLERTQAQTQTGGSEFTPVAVSTPLDVPAATVTVLFRPFPWEARNTNGVIASLEGIVLGCLFVVGYRRIITWFRVAPNRPYLVFAVTYAAVFIVAFSYIANFGILARQRTQMLPLILTLIAMYPAPRKRVSWLGFRPDRVADSDDAAVNASSPRSESADRVATARSAPSIPSEIDGS